MFRSLVFNGFRSIEFYIQIIYRKSHKYVISSNNMSSGFVANALDYMSILMLRKYLLNSWLLYSWLKNGLNSCIIGLNDRTSSIITKTNKTCENSFYWNTSTYLFRICQQKRKENDCFRCVYFVDKRKFLSGRLDCQKKNRHINWNSTHI